MTQSSIWNSGFNPERAALFVVLVLGGLAHSAPSGAFAQFSQSPPPSAEDLAFINYSQATYIVLNRGRSEVNFVGDARLTLNRVIAFEPVTTPAPQEPGPPVPAPPLVGRSDDLKNRTAGTSTNAPASVLEYVAQPLAEMPLYTTFLKLGRSYVNVNQVAYSYVSDNRRYLFFNNSKKPLIVASDEAKTFAQAVGSNLSFLKLKREGGVMYLNRALITYSAENRERTHNIHFSGNPPIGLNVSEVVELRNPIGVPAPPTDFGIDARSTSPLAPPAPDSSTTTSTPTHGSTPNAGSSTVRGTALFEYETTLFKRDSNETDRAEAARHIVELWPESKGVIEHALFSDDENIRHAFIKFLYRWPEFAEAERDSDLAKSPDFQPIDTNPGFVTGNHFGGSAQLFNPQEQWTQKRRDRGGFRLGGGGFRLRRQTLLPKQAYGDLARHISSKMVDENLEVQWRAVRALHLLGADAEPGLDMLIKIISDNQKAYRLEETRTNLLIEAVDALVDTVSADKQALPILIGLASHYNRSVRLVAVRGLGAIWEQSNPALNILTRALQDNSDHDVQFSAAVSLGSYGPRAKSAVNSMVDLFHKTRSDFDRSMIRSAIMKIEPESGKNLKVHFQ